MLIRLATEADIPPIARLHVDAWKHNFRGIISQRYLDDHTYEWREERWRQGTVNYPGNGLTLVAEQNGQILGFVSLGPVRGDHPPLQGEIYALYIAPASQRQGVGRALFEEGRRHLASMQLKGLLIWSLEANPACHFYRQLGGVEVAKKDTPIGEERLPSLGFGWD